MANLKINDLPATGSVSASMQLETDIGGTTPNKVTAAQLRNFAINNVNQGSLGATFPASAVGKSASVRPNFAGTITSAVMDGDVSGSAVVAVARNGLSIVASTPPTLNSAITSRDATLSGWTTGFSAGDLITFTLTSASTLGIATCTLNLTKS